MILSPKNIYSYEAGSFKDQRSDYIIIGSLDLRCCFYRDLSDIALLCIWDSSCGVVLEEREIYPLALSSLLCP